MDNTTPTYEMNKTYTYVIENYGFDMLNIEEVNNIYKDGRVFSHFIELWLAKKFTLKHINGCKDHDFTDINTI